MTFLIPGRLNLAIASAQVAAMLGVFYAAGQVGSPWAVVGLSVLYALVMNSGYAMLHEAEHGLLHPDRRVNEGVGVLLALFFPAPFHLLRQGHLGHHQRNRSDDEAFDFYFEGESRAWKFLQLYGILTGLFWVVILLGNVVALVAPALLKPKVEVRFDRSIAAFFRSVNPRFHRVVQAEAALACLLHGGLFLWAWGVPFWRWAAVLGGFGFLWSALQYVHHYGTERHVQQGARNLRTWAWVDLLWLNHNWHLNHHLSPTVPWVYLPHLHDGRGERFAVRGSLLRAYLRMWRGPRPGTERVRNVYEGEIIR